VGGGVGVCGCVGGGGVGVPMGVYGCVCAWPLSLVR
jgi:hypothetical protein